METVEALGAIAGLLTTAAFVPQVWKTWRSQSADDFSLPMLVMFVAGLALWLAYGIWKDAPSVVAANSVTVLLAGYILKVKLGNTKSHGSEPAPAEGGRAAEGPPRQVPRSPGRGCDRPATEGRIGHDPRDLT